MKKLITTLGIAIFTTLTASAQNAAMVYELSELTGNGIIVLTSGDTLKGELLYWPHKHERMWFKQNPTDKQRRELNPGQVKFFRFNDSNRLFEGLQESSDNEKKQDSAFYERVNPANLKFGIYKEFRSTGKMVGGKLEGSEAFFITIKGHLNISHIASKTLRPLNEKLPAFLADCPELQQKVSSEQEGYKMPMVMGTDKKISILIKIAEEYEGCGK